HRVALVTFDRAREPVEVLMEKKSRHRIFVRVKSIREPRRGQRHRESDKKSVAQRQPREIPRRRGAPGEPAVQHENGRWKKRDRSFCKTTESDRRIGESEKQTAPVGFRRRTQIRCESESGKKSQRRVGNEKPEHDSRKK